MSLKNFTQNLQNVTCQKDDTVGDVAILMKTKGVGTVVVTENRKPVGIVTDRDLALRCLTNGRDNTNLEIKEIMTTPIHLIKEDASILDLIEEMNQQKVRRICVINSREESLGVVSMADVFELLSHEMGELSQAIGQRHEKLFRRTKDSHVERSA